MVKKKRHNKESEDFSKHEDIANHYAVKKKTVVPTPKNVEPLDEAETKNTIDKTDQSDVENYSSKAPTKEVALTKKKKIIFKSANKDNPIKVEPTVETSEKSNFSERNSSAWKNSSVWDTKSNERKSRIETTEPRSKNHFRNELKPESTPFESPSNPQHRKRHNENSNVNRNDSFGKRDTSSSSRRADVSQQKPTPNFSGIHGQNELSNLDSDSTRDNTRYSRHRSPDRRYHDKKNRPSNFSSSQMRDIVKEVNGDLFMAPSDCSLAHCVAEDMRMGSGIATTFRQMFRNQDDLLSQNQRAGGLAVLEDKDRYIYYLVTKKVSNGKPTMRDFKDSIRKLKEHCFDHKVRKIAMPRIGCGLDQLEWTDVKPFLNETFQDMEIEITVYNFQQNEGAASTETMNKPPITKNERLTSVDIQSGTGRIGSEIGKMTFQMGSLNQNSKAKEYKSTFVKNEALSLVDIQSGTGLIYIGYGNGKVTSQMESLNQKYQFLHEYKSNVRKVGSVIVHENQKDYVYGFIISDEVPFDFKSFQKCLTELKNINKKDKYNYFGIEAFTFPRDDIIMEKLSTLIKYSMSKDIEFWICWPKDLLKFMPMR